MTERVFKRSERVSENIFRSLSLILKNDVRDPRVEKVIITAVKVSEDLKRAKVYFSFLPEPGIDLEQISRGALKGLESARGFIKRELGRTLTIKFLPEIIFLLDPVPLQRDRLETLFKQIEETSLSSH